MPYKYIKILTFLAVLVCYMIALLTLQEHVIFYQEQHSLFLFSKAYYTQTIASAGPIAYVGAFMTQFYYYPWLGAFIIGMMAALIYLFIEDIISIIFRSRDFLQIGVIVAVALYFTLDNVTESPAWIALAFISLFLIWILLKIFLKYPKLKKSLSIRQLLLILILTAGYFCGGLAIEAKQLDRSERAMVLAEKAVKQKNWDKAIEITSGYLSTGRSNKLMLYLRSLALAQKGELLDHLFDYPHNHRQQALAFPWNSDSREVEYGHLVHEATGDINAAHQWAFEAMTVWGETAPHLLDLARYNVALGRPEVTKKFTRKLSQSLFYRKDAKKIERQADGLEDSDLKYSVPDSLTAKWINVLDFRPNLMQNYNADPENQITRQYLMASMLLSNNLLRLIPMLKQEDLKCKNIREAILIYNLYPGHSPLKEFGLKVDDETGRDFSNFYRMLKKADKPELKKHYGNTYWYYKHIVNPSENG